MRLFELKITSRFKNLNNIQIDFRDKEGLSLLIGNNGTGKSNILEAISAIFAGLYDSEKSPDFSYHIYYQINHNDIRIEYNHQPKANNYKVLVNNTSDNIKDEYLPSQVITCYSGEETRLWQTYYEHFYKKFNNAIIKGNTIPSQQLVFINRFYWDIALLTFHFYDFEIFTDLRDFCQKELGIHTINYIKFKFDVDNLKSWNKNLSVEFVKSINPNSDIEISLTLEELKSRLNHITNEKDFFNYLTSITLPKEDKLITDIEFCFNSNLTTASLSEGEKKLILVKLILEVLGDENSLILLDEPDSHIHISRKTNLHDLLATYENRENIITTHSPTLTHCFDSKHIIMLSRDGNLDAEIVNKEKRQIIETLTNNMWSYQKQNIFLNSTKDILLVEGKTDEVFIRKALSVLKNTKPEYQNLDFEYLPCGGADGVSLFIDKFTPRSEQKIIALFDRDSAGWQSINSIMNKSKKWNSGNFGKYQIYKNIIIMPYPKRSYFRGTDNFNIEDYFPKRLLNHYALRNFKSLDTLITKNGFKRSIASECESFDDADFKHFKKLFDLILEAKSN